MRSSLDELIERAAKLCVEGVGGEISPRMRLLAYGFGFGNPLSSFFGTAGPKVRDLLDLGDGAPSAVTIDRLARDWRVYREHIGDLARGMFGDTPMAEALRTAEERLRRELADGRHSAPPILIIVSDGEPTDEGPEAVRAIAERMSRSGVMIVTCFLTDADLTEPKRLYGSPQPGWSDGARLMFDCASMLPARSPFDAHFRETKWTVEPQARLFTQINHSETLAEFSKVVLSPLAPEPADRPIRVFVTYSHQDEAYLETDSLLGFLKGLEREGFEFFTDRQIVTGRPWDQDIKQAIARTDVVLALVSQAFLDSEYCRNVEIERFLQARRAGGTVILPVILSPCDWRSHPWLAETQARPRNGRTIESDFRDPGERKQVFLDVRQDIQAAGKTVRP